MEANSWSAAAIVKSSFVYICKSAATAAAPATAAAAAAAAAAASTTAVPAAAAAAALQLQPWQLPLLLVVEAVSAADCRFYATGRQTCKRVT